MTAICELTADLCNISTCQGIATNVVPTHKPSWSTDTVKKMECRITTTLTIHDWIGLARATKVVTRPMLASMLPIRQHLKILWSIVMFVAIEVMDHFAATQWSIEHFRRDQPVLIDISARVGHWMFGALDEHVPARCDRAPASPVGVVRTRQTTRFSSHADSIANRRCQDV